MVTSCPWSGHRADISGGSDHQNTVTGQISPRVLIIREDLLMTIRDWPQAERPRERLLAEGPAALTDAQLLAIFFRTGTPGCSAVELARDALKHFGGVRELLNAGQLEFCAVHGLGTAKYAQLKAVMELARRSLGEELKRGPVLSNPDATRRYMRAWLRDFRHEHFVAVYLDNRHQVIASEVLAEGTIDGASVYPREVVQKCLKKGAAAVIFAHNHPSGIAEPSAADRRITRRLTDALALFDVRVLDHLIVGDRHVVSFAERGLV